MKLLRGKGIKKMSIVEVLKRPKKQVSLPKPILKTKPEPVNQVRYITREEAEKQILKICQILPKENLSQLLNLVIGEIKGKNS
jgi:hypothetical protein